MEYIIFLCSLLSGFFYMLGGREMKIKSGWFRDLFCPLFSLIVAVCMFPNQEWYKYLFIVVMQFWACRDYFNWVNKILLDFSKECRGCLINKISCDVCLTEIFYKNKQWWNWLLIGVVASAKWLVFMPLNPATATVLTLQAVLVMIFSVIIKKAEAQEFARGALIL